MRISYAFCKLVNTENLYYKEFFIFGLWNCLRKSYWLPHCMLYSVAYTAPHSEAFSFIVPAQHSAYDGLLDS